MKLVGIDLSLTGTGVAVHEPGGLTFTRVVGEAGHLGASLKERRARLRRLIHDIGQYTRTADAVAIESHDFSAKYGSQHDRSGAWWLFVDDLAERGIPVATIAPKTLKMYLADNGNASKKAMLAAGKERYPTVDIRKDDQADAMAALSMLVRRLELAPLEDAWLEKMGKAMDGVDWSQIDEIPR